LLAFVFVKIGECVSSCVSRKWNQQY